MDVKVSYDNGLSSGQPFSQTSQEMISAGMKWVQTVMSGWCF